MRVDLPAFAIEQDLNLAAAADAGGDMLEQQLPVVRVSRRQEDPTATKRHMRNSISKPVHEPTSVRSGLVGTVARCGDTDRQRVTGRVS